MVPFIDTYPKETTFSLINSPRGINRFLTLSTYLRLQSKPVAGFVCIHKKLPLIVANSILTVYIPCLGNYDKFNP